MATECGHGSWAYVLLSRCGDPPVLQRLSSSIAAPSSNEQTRSSLISELFVNEAKALIENGNVGGGMIPKLQNCIDAIESGVNRVHILDGRIQHCLLLEIFTNKGIGTAILREGEGKYYNEENK